jgi:hypothetical protein
MADGIKAPNQSGKKKVSILSIISLVISLFSVLILLVVGVLLISLFQRINRIEQQVVAMPPEFAITNFSYEEEIDEYEYIEDVITYIGSGVIIEKSGNDSNYLILFSRTLVGGGSGDIGDSDIFVIPVIDGYADFSTYDYGDVGTVAVPQYEFDILGYLEMDN